MVEKNQFNLSPAPQAQVGRGLYRRVIKTDASTPFTADFPDVAAPLLWNDEYKYNTDRIAAKQGDEAAGKGLAERLVTPEFAAEIRASFGDVVLTPVVDVETKNANILPQAFANRLWELTGWPINRDIIKINKTVHVAADNAVQRLVQRARYVGEINPGKEKYLIVDDFVSLGSTIADLRNFIMQQGGQVVGATALAASQKSSLSLPAKKAHIRELEKYGRTEIENILRKYTIAASLEDLTNAETRVLLRIAGYPAVRGGELAYAEGLDRALNRALQET